MGFVRILKFVLKTQVDISLISEAHLGQRIPCQSAKLLNMDQKDRSTLGGGIAFCHKEKRISRLFVSLFSVKFWFGKHLMIVVRELLLWL